MGMMKDINSINTNLHQLSVQRDLRRIANAADPAGDPRKRHGALGSFARAFLLLSVLLLVFVVVLVIVAA